MNAISVTETADGSAGIITVGLERILFLKCNTFESQSILVHTRDGVYYIMGPLRYWVNALNSTGCHFSIVDRGTAVNIDNVERLERTYKVAYFDNMSSQTSISCTIAYHRYRLVEQELTRMNPNIIVC
ncbi:LytTR family transcriptional regulator DNA-binding domain-containing protein [Paenibacillus sp. HW567]|uniref:LytTR family transcriptional regulator DNA-binding domain-containing protein n=1 Tax=Paenibacillus sp. HW567 TaxID=1034769 RepID=UPI00036E9251|nr:LytTR family transcriptional regulator DNA-binding domain-containing protein [Paenibacillus sp. HW567]